MDKSNSKQNNKEWSIKSLRRLYSTVVALSLTASMFKIVSDNAENAVVNWGLLPFLGAFLVTMILFYHGAMVHLNSRCYDKNSGGIVILISFVMLFAESCLLVGMALLLRSPIKFAWAFVMLLGIDVTWGIFCACLQSQEKKTEDYSLERRWAKLNFFAGAILLTFLVILPSYQTKFTNLQVGMLLLIWAFVRSGIDYLWCWELYFQKDSKNEINNY